MTLIISIILIYLTTINIYLYNKEKKKSLSIRTWIMYCRSLLFILFYLFFFILFIRLLSFFRVNNIIDLKYYFVNYNIIILLVSILFLFSLRKLLFFFFKTSFFRLHYFYLAPENNSYCIMYYKFYINFIYFFSRKFFIYFFWLDKLMTFLLGLVLIYDLISFNFILNYTLWFLKYYSFLKMIYIIINFIATKQQLSLDYYIFNLYYYNSVNFEEGFFAETLSSKAVEINDYEDDIIKH